MSVAAAAFCSVLEVASPQRACSSASSLLGRVSHSSFIYGHNALYNVG